MKTQLLLLHCDPSSLPDTHSQERERARRRRRRSVRYLSGIPVFDILPSASDDWSLAYQHLNDYMTTAQFSQRMDHPSQFAERMDQPSLFSDLMNRSSHFAELVREVKREVERQRQRELELERKRERERKRESELRSQLFQLFQRMGSHERSQFFQLAERFAAEPASPWFLLPHSITPVDCQPSAPAGGMNQRSQFAEPIAADLATGGMNQRSQFAEPIAADLATGGMNQRSQYPEPIAADLASPCIPPPAPAGGMNQRSQFAEPIAADLATGGMNPRSQFAEPIAADLATGGMNQRSQFAEPIAADCQPSAPAGGVLVDPNALSKAFVVHYYTTLYTNRPGLADLYQDASMLTFEGERFQGAENIAAKLASVPFQQCQHNITNLNCQPSGSSGGVLVVVGGILQLDGGQRALNFYQMFHLMPTPQGPQGSFYVHNDIFHVYHA